MNFGNAPVLSQGTVPPPSAQGVSGILPGQSAVNTTRILELTGFSKDLKTRDIQNIFVDFEDDRGGYRIKWLDDTGCLIVFSDPLTAKRAFLHLLANPHPHLIPSKTAEGESVVPKLRPYTGEDVGAVVASVANRPRSRSIANNNPNNGSPSGVNAVGGHGRRMSSSNNSSIHARSGSIAAGGNDRRSFGRQSMSQGQMQAMIRDQSADAGNGRAPSPTDTKTEVPSGGGAIDWQNLSASSPARGRAVSGQAGMTFSPPVSPEKGMRAGATSPSALRRLVQQRG